MRRKSLEIEAVRGIDFEVAEGELFGLLGPNGAGKTTTIKMLITLLIPTAGSARVLGLDVVEQAREVRKRIGYVFGGERGVYERLSGYDNLRYFAELYGVPPSEQRPRIEELLELVGLKGREHERAEGYSRGMKQRLHVARGLLHDPDVLFLDEPTIGLDPVGARDVRATIASLTEAGQDRAADDALHVRGRRALRPDRRDLAGPDRRRGDADRAEARRRRGHASSRSRSSASPTSAVERVRELGGVSVGRRSRSASRRRCSSCRPGPALELTQAILGCLDGAEVGRISQREPTLEDAYVALVTGMSSLRFVGVSWLLQFKMIMRSPFDGFGNVIYPLFFATVAFFVFRAGSQPADARLRLARRGRDGDVVVRQHLGRLGDAARALVGHARAARRGAAPLRARPPPRHARRWRRSGSTTWSRRCSGAASLFGIDLTIEHPLLFALSILGTVLSFGGLGFLFAVSFVRFRAAWVLGNFFEYPVWLICGFLVPLSLLPRWVRPISWVLAPTWGMSAIRESALGGTPLPDLLLCLGLGAAYVAVGVLVTDRVLRAARQRGTLSLT